MKKVVLKRLQTGVEGTFGTLQGEGFSFFTGELPNHKNENDFSCIPQGLYRCHWTRSARFRRFTYEVSVPGRFAIRIHPANFMGDSRRGLLCQLHGCVALGEKLGVMEHQKCLLLSVPAIRGFETVMGKKDFLLEVS